MTEVHLKRLIRLTVLIGILNIPFWSVYILIVDYIIGLIWIDFFLKKKAIEGIEVIRKIFPSRVFINEGFLLQCQVVNKSNSKVELEFISALDVPGISRKATVLNLSPDERKELNLRGFFYTRGVKKIGDSYMSILGPLSIYRINRSFRFQDELVVFPFFEESRFSKEVLRDILPGNKTQYKMLEDTASLRNIREYSSEPLNRVHWKLSARYDRLMCKEFDRTAQGSVKLFVDLNMPQGILVNETWRQMRANYEDQAVDAAGSILRDLKGRSTPVHLTVVGKDIWSESHPRKEFVSYLETLTRATGKEEPDQSIIDVLRESLARINQNDTVVLVSMHLTDNELPLILRLRAKCSKVIILLMPYGFRPSRYRPSRSYSMPHPEAVKLLEKSEILIENKVIVRFMLENDALQEALELVP